MATATDRIHLVWQWCCDAYLQLGNRRLAFPKDTDPTKTYQWRYLEALERKFIEWQFDDQLCRAFIEVAVKYARTHKLLNKGLSIFHQSNLLKVCYDQLRAQISNNEDSIEAIIRTKRWLDEQTGGVPFDQVLMERSSIGAYPNIIKWYQAGKLPDLYLAISRSCGAAIAKLSKLNKIERAALPNDARLFLLRTSFMRVAAIRFKLRDILQDEWRKPICQ